MCFFSVKNIVCQDWFVWKGGCFFIDYLADLKIRLEKKFSIYIENGAVYEWKTVKDVVEDVYHLANY